MPNVLLASTGSVAAVKLPALAAGFLAAGHAVKAVATDAAAYFFDPADVPCEVFRDADEWPNARYARGDDVLHIQLRKWADVLVVAPLDANTLAKFAVGLADNLLTCVWRAWDPAKPVVFAPAMNTLMWEHPFTRRHLRAVAADFGAGHIPGHLDQDVIIPVMNDRCKGLRVVPPASKALACGDVGTGAMGAVGDVVAAVTSSFSR